MAAAASNNVVRARQAVRLRPTRTGPTVRPEAHATIETFRLQGSWSQARSAKLIDAGIHFVLQAALTAAHPVAKLRLARCLARMCCFSTCEPLAHMPIEAAAALACALAQTAEHVAHGAAPAFCSPHEVGTLANFVHVWLL